MQLESTCLGQSQHPEVFEEALHQLHLVDHRDRLCWLVKPVEHRLDLAPDHGERGAQLVTEVGEEPASSLVLLLESHRHPVEGGADRPERPRSHGW